MQEVPFWAAESDDRSCCTRCRTSACERRGQMPCSNWGGCRSLGRGVHRRRWSWSTGNPGLRYLKSRTARGTFSLIHSHMIKSIITAFVEGCILQFHKEQYLSDLWFLGSWLENYWLRYFLPAVVRSRMVMLPSLPVTSRLPRRLLISHVKLDMVASATSYSFWLSNTLKERTWPK